MPVVAVVGFAGPDQHERLPTLPGWVQVHGQLPPAISISAWQRGPVCVISALENAELPDKSGEGPQWHISISRGSRRPKPLEVRAALRAFFGGERPEEDNHHPGNARHFWMPVDPEHRVDCECKEEEQLVVEPDGLRWTNPKDGPCRGCAISPVTGRPCPLHGMEKR